MDINLKQYYEFYNGLIRKFRDEKKLVITINVFKAHKYELRLATTIANYLLNLY